MNNELLNFLENKREYYITISREIYGIECRTDIEEEDMNVAMGIAQGIDLCLLKIKQLETRKKLLNKIRESVELSPKTKEMLYDQLNRKSNNQSKKISVWAH